MGYINGKLEYAGKQYDIPYTRKDLAPVVQKLDSAIHRINHCALDSTFGFYSLILIRRIEIYPVDGAIQLWNNWGL